jgi:hypothetical protein
MNGRALIIIGPVRHSGVWLAIGAALMVGETITLPQAERLVAKRCAKWGEEPAAPPKAPDQNDPNRKLTEQPAAAQETGAKEGGAGGGTSPAAPAPGPESKPDEVSIAWPDVAEVGERVLQAAQAIGGLAAEAMLKDGVTPKVDALAAACGLADLTGGERNAALALWVSVQPKE